jgi:hypothetical protein
VFRIISFWVVAHLVTDLGFADSCLMKIEKVMSQWECVGRKASIEIQKDVTKSTNSDLDHVESLSGEQTYPAQASRKDNAESLS